MKPLSIAVCFSGQMRSFTENLPDLVKMFRNAAGPDGSVSYFGALHWEDREYAAVKVFPNDPFWTAVLLLEMQKDPRLEGAPLFHPRAENAAHAIGEQWQGLQAVGRVLRLTEEARGHRFDWVIRCRPDLRVEREMESLAGLDSGAIYIPAYDNWGGCNDRFAFGSSVLMEKYFNYPVGAVMELLRAQTGRLANPLADLRNPESLLCAHLEVEGVAVRRTCAVLATNRGRGVVELVNYFPQFGDSAPPDSVIAPAPGATEAPVVTTDGVPPAPDGTATAPVESDCGKTSTPQPESL